MDKGRLAVTAALALSMASLTPLAAHAASSDATTYYVSSSNTSCDDSGPGTEAEPFCTIQAAAAATTPGDAVLIGYGAQTGTVEITASGTAADPITYEAVTAPTGALNGQSVSLDSDASDDAYGLYLDGASYIDLSGISFEGYTSTSHYVQIENSSHVTVSQIYAVGNVLVTGDSGDVTISRAMVGNQNRGFTGSAFEIDSSGTGNVVTTSIASVFGNGAGITVDGSADADITSNTIWDYCGAGIGVGDDSNGVASGATIENNVIDEAVTDSNDEGVCTAGSTSGISVQSAADESGLTANYNDVYPEDSLGTEVYDWAGTAYSTPADLDSATGQGAADSIADPEIDGDGLFVENESSSVINAANSDAPDELATDIDGNARVFDPNVAETGAGTPGYDRGAVQYAETLHAGNLDAPATAPSDAAVTIDPPTMSDDWANATYTYTYDFGDGSADVTATTGVTHTYTSTGSYTITVKVTSDFGDTASTGFGISILKPVAFSASLVPDAQFGLSVLPDYSVTTDWPVTSQTVNYGDGTATVNITPDMSDSTLFHTYAEPGTYTMTYTVADAGGDSKTVAEPFTTAGGDYYPYGPTRLLDTRKDLGGTSAEISHDGSIKLKVAGSGTIPADVSAVVLNLTVVGASGNGYIQANEGSGSTGTSNLNYRASAVYSNNVVAAVAPDGTVTLQNFGVTKSVTLQLIADISGYYAPTDTDSSTGGAGSEFKSLQSSARIMDTRSGLGGNTGKLAAGKTDVLTIAGADGGALPSSGITAVALNLTATGTSGSGFLTVYADGTTLPGTSNLDWQGSTTKPTAAVVTVGADGEIDIFNGSDDGGGTDVLVDVSGYYTRTTQGAVYVPITPIRALDTRTAGNGKLPANSPYQLDMNSVAGGPFSLGMGGPLYPIQDYVENTTVTDTQASGWLSAGSGATVPPATSNLNWSGSGQTTANLSYAISEASDYQVAYYTTYYNGGGSISQPVDLIVDVMGYFSVL